jgi:hypothetical protein
MAAAKKPATKKAAAKKAPVKKVVAKKAPAKKTPVKKAGSKKSAQASAMRSFRLARANESFTTFKITRQTLYWVILIAFIVVVQLWILRLQSDIATLLEIQQTQMLEDI